MRARVTNTRKKASKLHGATAGYLSIVDRGANETPFQMIKSAEGTGAMGITKRTKVAASHKKITTGRKAEAEAPVTKTIMAKMVFDQDHFEDEAAVQEWIEKAAWDAEGVNITDDGNGNFVARPEGYDTDAAFTKLAAVDAEEEGVSAFVGEIVVKADDEADDEEEDDDDEGDDDGEEVVTETKKVKPAPVKKTAAAPVVETKTDAPKTKLSKRAEFIAKAAKNKIVKFDGWDAYWSKKSTLSEALEAGMKWDATPPGFYDVQSAFNGVVAAILGDDVIDSATKATSLQKAAGDYADILVGLDSFFEGYINAGEETIAKSFETTEAVEKLAKWADDYAAFIAEKGVNSTAPVTKAVVKKADTEAAAIDYSKVADLVTKAMAPVLEEVAGVTATVTAMADRRPIKKGADMTDIGTTKPVQVEKAETTEGWAKSKMRKGMFG